MEKIVFIGGVFLFLIVALNSIGSVPVGTVTIVTEPADALIIIDDLPRDFSPMEASMSAGKHTILVAKFGYETYQGTFTLTEGEKRTVKITLEEAN